MPVNKLAFGGNPPAFLSQPAQQQKVAVLSRERSRVYELRYEPPLSLRFGFVSMQDRVLMRHRKSQPAVIKRSAKVRRMRRMARRARNVTRRANRG